MASGTSPAPAPTSKECATCKATLTLDNFYSRSDKSEAFHQNCKKCYNAAGRRNTVNRRLAHPKKSWSVNATQWLRARSRKQKRPFNLTAPQLLEIAPDVCPVLGFPLDYTYKPSGAWCQTSPSVDRLEPALGYACGNIIVVSQLANAIRSTGTPAQIRMVADYYDNLLNKSTE